jgi:FHS family L-fucose permease-like MFS transporter
MLIQFTFFTAYFVMSMPSGWIVTKIGYQKGIVVGLMTSAVGCLLFFPAASVPSYPIFLTALFILASGITLLQVAANPYVSVLGKPETASSRLNLAQAFNSLGTTIGPYLGGLLIFSGTIIGAGKLAEMSASEIQAYKIVQAESVQAPYLILAGILVLLAIFIWKFNLPRILDAEANEKTEGSFKDALSFRHLRLGVIGVFVYVGAEVAIGSFLVIYFTDSLNLSITEQQAAGYVSFYWGGAMIGRFIGSALLQKFNAGKFLGFAAILAMVLVALTISTGGMFALWAILAVGLFNSVMFPTIFTLAIKDMGSLTGRASSMLVMAIVGGAVIPLLMGFLADTINLKYAFFLPILCYLYIMFYGFEGSEVVQDTSVLHKQSPASE